MNLKVKAKLDPNFEPLSVVVREMREATKENGQDVIVAIERNKGQLCTGRHSSHYKVFFFQCF